MSSRGRGRGGTTSWYGREDTPLTGRGGYCTKSGTRSEQNKELLVDRVSSIGPLHPLPPPPK